MHLHRLQDIQFGSRETVFKESSLRQFLIALFLSSLPVGIYYFHKTSGIPVIFVYSSSIIAVWALYEFYVFKRTFSPENWLLRLDRDKIRIKFRSFLNRDLPDTDKQVVTIPLSEIKEVRALKETIKTAAKYGYSSRPKYLFFTELEIVLHPIDTQELGERLKYEINVRVRGGTKHHHYPVSLLDGGRIRIEWSSPKTGVSPRIGRVLKLFASYGVKVAPQAQELKDYVETANVDKVEMDTRILELVQKGNIIKAKELAKHAYKMTLEEANKFVNELMGIKSRDTPLN